jgi:hypothetical protein
LGTLKNAILINMALLLLLLLLLQTRAVSTAVQAEFVEIDTMYGRIRGIKESNPDVTAFYGVPFANPPVGELRWAPPQLPQPWTDTRDCTRDLLFHVRGWSIMILLSRMWVETCFVALGACVRGADVLLWLGLFTSIYSNLTLGEAGVPAVPHVQKSRPRPRRLFVCERVHPNIEA